MASRRYTERCSCVPQMAPFAASPGAGIRGEEDCECHPDRPGLPLHAQVYVHVDDCEKVRSPK